MVITIIVSTIHNADNLSIEENGTAASSLFQFDTGIGDDYDYDSVNRRKPECKSGFNSDECNYSLYGTKYLGLETASGTVLGK